MVKGLYGIDGANDVGSDEYGSVSAVQGPFQTTGFDLHILGHPVAEQLVFEVASDKILKLRHRS